MNSNRVKNYTPILVKNHTRKMNKLLIISFTEKYGLTIRVGKATKINKMAQKWKNN